MADYKAPFYFNIKFYQASSLNKEKNSEHIRYIGTRPGVDRGLEIDPDKNIEPEQMSMNLTLEPESDMYDHYIREVADSLGPRTEVNQLEPGTAVHHIKYAHERPRSHGLFSSGDDELSMAEIQKELLKHEGMVWRVIISLHGDDAERLDMVKRQAWEETIKTQMPDMALQMGIQESNLRWVAAYHPEEGHPHAHIVFWEKKPKRRLGKVNEHVKKEMKKGFVQKIYAADRDRYGREKTEMRDKMRELGVGNLREAVQFFRGWKSAKKEADQLHNLAESDPGERLPPRVDVGQNDYMIKKLMEISKLLPGRGRLSLKLMPEEVKVQIRELAEWLYGQPQFNPTRNKYESASEILARPYTTKEDQLEKAVDNARKDMIDRLSQVVLKAAGEVGKENQFSIHPDKAKIVAEQIKGAMGNIGDGPQSDQFKMVIMMDFIKAGFTKENFLELIDKLNLPRYSDSYIDYSFKANTNEKELSKGVVYVLKKALGEKEAQALVNRMGYSDKELEKMSEYSKAVSEETVEQAFDISDYHSRIIGIMSKVLFAAGLIKENVEQIINDWNTRSASNIPQEKIDKAIKAADKEVSEGHDWGRTPVVKRKDFVLMSNVLGITAEYPWRSLKELKFLKRGHSTSVVQGVFKKVLKQLTVQMKRYESEREREQMRVLNRIKVNVEREEDERDRKQKGKSR